MTYKPTTADLRNDMLINRAWVRHDAEICASTKGYLRTRCLGLEASRSIEYVEYLAEREKELTCEK